MSKEEKKAIERLSIKATTSSIEAISYPNAIVMKKDIKTVLNLIDKQQKEIEYFKNEKERIGKLQYDASETCFKNKEIILKQQKEIEELKKHFKMATRIIEGYADEVEKDTLKIENYRHKNIK